MTEPTKFETQRHLANTWLRRCTRYTFVSYGNDNQLAMLKVPFEKKTYNSKSWESMRLTLRALYELEEKQSYYLKADQDTYIIMENLRYMLEFEDPNQPFIMGHVHEPDIHGGKLSHTAGYVLSRNALKMIVTKGLDFKPECGKVQQTDDVQMSICAEAVGVKVVDKLDFLGKSRFSNSTLPDLVGPYQNNTPRWYPAETDYTLPNYDLRKVSVVLPYSSEGAVVSDVNASELPLCYQMYNLKTIY